MKNALMILMLATALVVFVIFWDSPPEVFLNRDNPPEATVSQANSYMINSETRKYDQLGLTSFVLNTSRGQFFKRQNKFVMDDPKIKANGDTPAQAPWHLTASTGEVFNRGKRVVMHGDVHAWQEAPDGKTELNTPHLVFYPDTNIAKTKYRVTLRSPGSKINGVGMKANLKQQFFQLLSKVKSKHRAAQ